MSYYPGGQPTQTQYTGTQQTSALNVPQQQRQSRPRATGTVGQSIAYDYQEQSANIPYGSHQSQTSALAVPQQHRQSQSTRPHSISPHASSRVDYIDQQSGFPSSYGGTSHAHQQMAYSDPAAYDSGGFLTAGSMDPGFPVPHAASTGAIQRSHSGNYREAPISSSANHVRRSPSAHTTHLYAPTHTNSSVRRSPSEQPAALRSTAISSVRRSPSTHSSTLYPPNTGNTSVYQRGSGEQPETLYAPGGGSIQPRPPRLQQPEYYTSSGAQGPAFDFESGDPSYTGPQQTGHYAVPHGSHGASASDARYQTGAVPVTRHGIAPEPSYRETHPQERVVTVVSPRDGYEYENLSESELVPKGPGHVPAQGRPHTCRMPGCNRPMYFDRRFNEFWEWCSTQHIHDALGRGMEKVCKRCAVWPRKYGYRYCGGDACNKRGVPL